MRRKFKNRNYLNEKYMRGKDQSVEERSILHESLKEKEPQCIENITQFFLEKELNKYSGGIDEILKETKKDEGIALILNCDQEFYETFSLKKDVKEDPSLNLELTEDFPNKNDDYSMQKWEILIKNLSESKKNTSKYIYILKKAFSLDKTNKIFLDRYIQGYSQRKAKIFQELEPKKNKFYLENLNDIVVPATNKLKFYIDSLFDRYDFFIWKYEDFIINFVTLVKFFTGLKLTMEILPDLKIVINFFCTEPNLRGLAESFGYDLQIKNYALKYLEISREIKKKSLNQDLDQSDNALLIDDCKENLQFHELNHDNQFHFPPYINYQREINEKFRRYTKNDLYHECAYDTEFSQDELPDIVSTEPTNVTCCSNLRNIDRLRLIFRAFDEVVVLNKLRKKYFDSIIIQRNYKAYKECLETK